MRAEYDFSKGKRGAVIPQRGKTRISIFIDNSVLDEFRTRASTELSMKMEMRVLPFCGMTAPRLPLEKSYSALISLALLSRRPTRRDRAALVVALCPNHHK